MRLPLSLQSCSGFYEDRKEASSTKGLFLNEPLILFATEIEQKKTFVLFHYKQATI